MSTLGVCAGLVAPYYNLAMVGIIILLFIRLFRIKKPKAFITPWKYFFIAICFYIIQEILYISKILGYLDFPFIINGIFELGIISIFTYVILLQKEHMNKKQKKK